MDVFLALALLLPFTGKSRKQLSAIAFFIALMVSVIEGQFIGVFFFSLSLMVFWLSDWSDAKYPLFFLAMFDLIGLLNSSNLVELFLYFELAIYASYFLILEKRDLKSVFRYFVVNSVGSALMLFSIAVSYYQTGSITLLTPQATIFFALGLLIKLGIAPFQDWLVEIYRSASLSSIIFFSAILTEISPLALLLVIKEPSPILQIFAMFSMFIANMMALTEVSMKRILALFDASNLAYVLLAIAAASPASRTAALYMMFSHVIAMTFAFTALIISGSKTIHDLRAPKGIEIPFYASFFALAGLPPFHLFPSKILLFSSVFSISEPLSYVLLLNLVLSALVALRVFSSIKGSRNVRINKKFKTFFFVMLAISLLLGFFPLKFFEAIKSQMGLFIMP
ncbi:MAG: hypothetical protein GOV01_00655 [Candidatus Altiarchaeota archaeon]|nr:hypothetical protein [Candidatus Altiarchaeota archaeon]